MRQNDKVLRYLTVRTDEDLKRAARRAAGAPAPAAPRRARSATTPRSSAERRAPEEEV